MQRKNKTRTLIIIGAGTSIAIHPSFPTGIELANLIDVHLITTKKKDDNSTYISTMMNEVIKIFEKDVNSFDGLIDELKRELWYYVQEYYYENIRKEKNEAISISIDNLISEKFSNDSPVSKLAKQCIAYLLKGHEDAYFEKVTSHGSISCWIDDLFTILKSKGWTFDDVNNDFRVISFNYERVFEYIGCKSVEKVFNKTLNKLPFIEYAYGNIGTLLDIPFESKNTSDKMRDCFKSIKLIGERDSVRLESQINDFEKVLFIGFGFDKDNLKGTLKIDTVRSAKLYGMVYEDEELLKRVRNDFPVISIDNYSKITDFLEKYLE